MRSADHVTVVTFFFSICSSIFLKWIVNFLAIVIRYLFFYCCQSSMIWNEWRHSVMESGQIHTCMLKKFGYYCRLFRWCDGVVNLRFHSKELFEHCQFSSIAVCNLCLLSFILLIPHRSVFKHLHFIILVYSVHSWSIL